MKQAIFANGSNHDNREIMLQIGDYIDFFYYDQYNKQKIWIIEENDRRRRMQQPILFNKERLLD